jgi:hypothetical protein
MDRNLLKANWDRVGAWACIGVGGLVLFLGWQGVSREVLPAAQMPFIVSGGIGGALLVIVGATLLISADLRDEWQQLNVLVRHLVPEEAPESTTDSSPDPGRDAAPPRRSRQLNAGAGAANRISEPA